MDLHGDKIMLTIFQLFFTALVLYALYFKDDRLAYFILFLILLITFWKQYLIMSNKKKSLCNIVKKMHCEYENN
jgi:4-hydroxybenzoate polyprenyltransferase